MARLLRACCGLALVFLCLHLQQQHVEAGVPSHLGPMRSGQYHRSLQQNSSNAASSCNPDRPSEFNCLCKRPCKTEACLYRCHYDTIKALSQLAATPQQGQSLEAFQLNVRKLGLYLNKDVFARIYPLGVYSGPVMFGDYIATFVHPLGLGSVLNVVGVEIVNFANSGQVCSATVYLNYRLANCTACPLTNLTLTTFNRFDDNQKVIKADWNFIGLPESQLHINNGTRITDATLARMVPGICGVDQAVCHRLGMPGYNSTAQCAQFLMSIPRVAPHGVQGNNVYCRFLHMAYATVEPRDHCPHISMSGGGVCVDQNYTDYFKQFSPGDFVGIPVVVEEEEKKEQKGWWDKLLSLFSAVPGVVDRGATTPSLYGR